MELCKMTVALICCMAFPAFSPAIQMTMVMVMGLSRLRVAFSQQATHPRPSGVGSGERSRREGEKKAWLVCPAKLEHVCMNGRCSTDDAACKETERFI